MTRETHRRWRMVLLPAICACAASCVSILHSTPTYHVAPDGDDRNAGTRREPFRTLERARDAARALDAPRRIVLLAPGIYRRSQTLELDARDSGTVFRARGAGAGPSDRVRLTGGIDVEMGTLPIVQDPDTRKRLPAAVQERVRVIDLRARVPDWQVEAPWPDAFRGYAGWPEIFSNGQPLRLARWPNDGYAEIAEVTDRGSRPRHQEKPDRPGAFRFAEAEPASWSTEQDIFFGGYWCFSWYDEVLRVADIDREKKEIRFVVPHHYGIGGPSGGRYYALNVLETLDQPGEYVYDREGAKLYLLPPEGLAADARCTLSVLDEPLVRITGATGIRIEGIRFEAGRGTGIEIRESEDVRIDACRIHNLAKTAVVIQGGRRCGVHASELSGMGHGGVRLSGGDRASLTPAHHFVSDCTIHHYARLVQAYQPAVSVNGVGHRVVHNYIHHAPHNAILFGGNDHRIAHNRIERVCQDTADAGAIYCGRDWTLQGNVVEKNWIAHITKGVHHRTWAVYPDDQASGVTVRHNIIVDSSSGFLFGGGRDSVIEENLFVNVGEYPIRFDSRGLAWGRRSEPTLLKRLAAVPTDSEVWRTRFPTLVGLAENPQRNFPAGNTIRGNIAVNSAQDSIDANVGKAGTVEATRAVASDWKPVLEDGRVVFPTGGPALPEALHGLTVGPRSR